MNKKPSFFRQARVLIDRYFHVFINDKQNLLLMIAIPLLTILIVCVVACPDMFSVKPDDTQKSSINDEYPVLNWENVVQYKKNEDAEDDEDAEELVKIESSEVTTEKWDNSKEAEAPTTPTKVDGENYFLITNANQLDFLAKAAKSPLKEVREYLSYNYLLQVDLDLKNIATSPIGTKKYPFTGTFDGNGHIIRNLKIKSGSDYLGLFGYVKSNEKAKSKIKLKGNELEFHHNGTVKALQVNGFKISTKGKFVGAIAGAIDGSARIYNVSAKKGTIKADKGFAGGIVGRALSSKAEIYVCYSRCDVKSKGKNVGGLVGDLGSARLSGAYATGKVEYTGKNEDNAEHFGMLVGACDDTDAQLKNIFYDSDLAKDAFGAVNDKDIAGKAEGVETKRLYDYASFLVPFKGIESAYDILHPEEGQEEKDEDYDAEEDDDVDDIYGFKKDAQLEVFGGTQTGLFMLVCVAIFVGICNSIQEICKERNILKREYMTNLRLGSYVVSKLVVQAAICAVQMIVVVFIFYLFVHNKTMPDHGVIFSSIWLEFYITMFLLSFAADTMSLVISSIVKNSATANTFIPIILIVQIVFSGVLFDMKGVMDIFSNIMISKWGIAAFAASTGLNDSQPKFLIDNPAYQLQLGSDMSIVQNIYQSTAGNLLKIWGILLVFIVICSVACRILLIRVKKDKR